MTALAKIFGGACLKFSDNLFRVCKPEYAGPILPIILVTY
jgi:hypothetical protein